MPALIVNHKVADFDKWLKAYEGHAQTRSAAGITGSVVCQSADDPNNVTIYFEVTDLNRAREFTTSEDLKQTMQAAGVVSQPTITFMQSARNYPN
jgi:hypothetical protein